jgi:CRISPR-associated protein Cas1
METLYICGEADLSREENTILVKTGGRKKRIPIESVSHIVLTADGALTTKFLGLCGREGVRVSLFDYYGWFRGAFEPVAHVGAGEIKLRQAALILNSGRRLALARAIIGGALTTILENLRYYAYRGVDGLKPFLDDIGKYRTKLSKSDTIEALMGMEGMARRAYYEAWGVIDPRLAFAPRVKRPPNNRINCLMSFLNSLTYTAVRHEIAKTHLDETLSFLHAPSSGRSSLSLDLAELFKPVSTDRTIFSMARKNMIGDEWFEEREGVCLLTEAGRRNVVERFAVVMDRAGADGVNLRDLMRKEALKIQGDVLEMKAYVPFTKAS